MDSPAANSTTLSSPVSKEASLTPTDPKKTKKQQNQKGQKGEKSEKAEKGQKQQNQQNQQQGKKPKQGKQDKPNIRTPAGVRFDDVKTRSKKGVVSRKISQKPVLLFSHLPQYERETDLAAEIKAQASIHPAVLRLGLQFSECVLMGGNSRFFGMMNAFIKVVSDYNTPPGTSLQRHLTQHIGKQVDFLSNTRSLCESMKAGIKHVKAKIGAFPVNMPDEDAKADLTSKMEDYMNNVIELGNITIDHSLKQIVEDDVIMVFSRSSIVLKLLQTAKARHISFRVVVVDSRPKLEGKEMLRALVSCGIKCTYVFTSAVPSVISSVTKCFVGASAVLANGSILSRTGTALVCMAAFDCNLPVFVICESYKFSDTVRLDSFVWNELGDADELVDVSNRAISSRLPSTFPPPDACIGPQAGVLKEWKEIRDLKLLNLYYDVTPAKFISSVICEDGLIHSKEAFTYLQDSN